MRVCYHCYTNVEPSASACPGCASEQPLSGWPADALIGRSVAGRYRIERRIGVGGMGLVYRAVDREGRLVAVKTLHAHYGQSDEMVRRFRREARMAGLLEGPNVVRIYESGELPDGTLFYAMELVDGRSLTRILEEEGALPVPVAVEFLRQLAHALEEAHALGLVHRDLKPDNLVVAVSGRGERVLKVLDFGIVKVLDATIGTVGQTGTDKVFGTPEYMAPEQAQAAKHVDARADIYAAGIITFAMLTNRLPFSGDNPHAVLIARLRRDAPRISSLVGAGVVPAALEDLVARMLERDREARPESMAEVLVVLDGLDVGTPLPVPQRSSDGVTNAPTLPVALAPTVALGDVAQVPGPSVTRGARPALVTWGLAAVGFVAVMLAVAWIVGRV